MCAFCFDYRIKNGRRRCHECGKKVEGFAAPGIVPEHEAEDAESYRRRFPPGSIIGFGGKVDTPHVIELEEIWAWERVAPSRGKEA